MQPGKRRHEDVSDEFAGMVEAIPRLAVPGVADWCFLDLVEDGNVFRRVAIAHADPSKHPLADVLRRYPPGSSDRSLVFRVVRGEVIRADVDAAILAATASSEEHARAIAALGAVSFIMVPLLARGRCVGVLSLVTAESGRRYGDADVERVRDLASAAAVTLDSILLLREAHAARATAERAAARTAQFQEVTAALSGALTVEQIATIVVQRGIAALGGQAGSVALLAADGASIRVIAGVGYDQATLDTWRNVPIEARFPPTDVIRERQPIFLVCAEERIARYPHLAELIRKNGSGAMAAAPLVVDDRIIGSLGLNFASEHSFPEEERTFILTLARICAHAIERARLYEAEHQARERLQILAGVGSFLASSIDFDLLIDGFPGCIPPSLASVCWLEITDTDGTRRSFSTDEPRLREAVAMLDPAVGSPEGPMLVPDGTAVLAALGLSSGIVVPLVSSQGRRGTIGFGRREGPRYEAADLALSGEIARRVAAALDHARLYRAAKDADRRKDDFLAMLGHELRNPLAPMTSALHLMRDALPDPATLHRYRDMMERQTRRMARLVDDLLDVSRITRGKFVLRKETTTLGEVVRRAEETIRPQIDAGRQALEAHVPDTDVVLRADGTRLEQVLSNLLHNASKFSPEGARITLEASVSGEWLELAVRDEGVGIDPALLPRIFDPFFQTAQAIDRRQGGLGIGLTLVKTVVEMHDGTVAVHSDGAGRGTTVRVRLPVIAAADRAPSEGMPRSASRSIRVLVVDDNVDAASSLCELLQASGHQASCVHDGNEASAAAIRDRPEAVLLDIGLPGCDGFEVARRIRAEVGAEITLIALTGYGQPGDRARSREAGFDEHLVKPVDPGVLLGVLERRVATERRA